MDPQELRLQKLESIIPVLKQRLNAYDDTTAKIEAAYGEIKSLIAQFSNVKESTVSSCKNVIEDSAKLLHDKVNASAGVMSKQVLELKSDHEILKISHFHLSEKIQNFASISSRIGERLSFVESVLGKFAQSDSVKVIENALIAIDPKIALVVKGSQEGLDLLTRGLNEVKNMLPDIQNKVSVHSDGILNNIDSINALKIAQEQLLKQFSEKLTAALASCAKDVQSKIDAFPKPIIPSLDNLKSDLQKSIEPVSLDAKNANLRTQNLEVKIALQEKKIEQLTLLIQKLQLAK